MALADGYVAMSATKNYYNYWRPVSAIRTGETDNNPDTVGDPAWTPLRPTPPNQDYASGHAIQGGAAAEVLKQVFGTDAIDFRDCGVKLPAGSTCADPSPVLRWYTSFSSQAATETRIRASLLGFTSANRSKKAPNTVEKLASAPLPTNAGLCSELDGRSHHSGGMGRTLFALNGGARPLKRSPRSTRRGRTRAEAVVSRGFSRL
jgi:hypothetical protein